MGALVGSLTLGITATLYKFYCGWPSAPQIQSRDYFDGYFDSTLTNEKRTAKQRGAGAISKIPDLVNTGTIK
jgi:hypothetical protein